MPPMRKVRPTGASFAATCEGVKKNTRFLLKAESTSAAATPSAATPSAIQASRLCLGFTFSLEQYDNFDGEKCEGHEVRAPHIERIASHGEELFHAGKNAFMRRRDLLPTP